MSEYQDRLQLGSLSMRRVSHYMEYLARGGWERVSSSARGVRTEQPRELDEPVYTGRGVPDPWDVIEAPSPVMAEKPVVARPAVPEPAIDQPVHAGQATNIDIYDVPDWEQPRQVSDWESQVAYPSEQQDTRRLEQPEGILSDDELNRAMAFLSNDDEFLMTGVGVSTALPAAQTPAYEPRSQGRSRSSGYNPALDISDHDGDARVGSRKISGLRVLIVALAALFVLSVGGLAYVYFFTDWLSPAPAAVDAYEIFLGGESMGCVLDGQAVLDIIEKDRAQVQSDTGLPAQHALPVSTQPVRIEERFVAEEEEMIQRIRRRSEVLVESAGVYLDGRLVGAVDSEQTVDSILEKALAPFLSLLDKRELTDVGFAQQVSTKPLLVNPDKLMDLDTLYSLLMGESTSAKTYEVAQGDSLSAIARRNNLSLAQLRYANPSLIGQDLIHPGMELNMQPPSGLLTVQFTERVSVETTIPYETETKQSAKLYTTQKQVERKGVDGTRQVVAERRYVAGVMVEEIILEETVIKAPVSEIVVKGTKKPASGSAQSGSKYIKPVNGSISSRFGTRWGTTHYGLDYAASTGTPIYASRAGTVTFAGNSASYGKYIKIDHGDGVETRYAHCSALKVTKGTKVKQGDLIALVGSTGRSTGPHLHFEIRVNGVAKNPENYLR